MISFKKMQSLPNRNGNKNYMKGSKFEKGLLSFTNRTLKKSFEPFKNEFDLGQAQKKRAVIQLINSTMGGQKKFYQRWKIITDKTKLLN